jgi:hypothetical protein
MQAKAKMLRNQSLTQSKLSRSLQREAGGPQSFRRWTVIWSAGVAGSCATNIHTYIDGTYILFAAEIISGTVNPNLSSILFLNSAGIDQDIFLSAKKNW